VKFVLLFQGLIIGFSIAAPIGVIGILCISRTLLQGKLIGFISGLGAATAHGIYGCISGFGLTLISDFFLKEQFYLRLIGGIFLYYFGIKTFVAKPPYKKKHTNSTSLVNSYISSFVITITNPITILSFAAVFTGTRLTNQITNFDSALVFVLGIFLGSTCWWFILSGSIDIFKKKLNSQILQLFNRFSGIMIIFFGFTILYQLLIDWLN
jgi:threonine/homoserine/homoserine lactone efflux protein